MKVILVGQAPSRTSDPRRPLLEGRSGRRLRELMGLSVADYLRLFERRNLLPSWPGALVKGDAFPRHLVREAADALRIKLAGQTVVAVGRAVGRALGRDAQEGYLTWRTCDDGMVLATVPHPSGINPWWNAPGNVERARAFLRDVAERARALKDGPG